MRSSSQSKCVMLAILVVGLLGFPAIMTLKHAVSSSRLLQQRQAAANLENSNTQKRSFEFEDLPASAHKRLYKFEDEADAYEDTPYFGLQSHDAKHFQVLFEKQLETAAATDRAEGDGHHGMLRLGSHSTTTSREEDHPSCPEEENVYYIHQFYPCKVDFFCDWEETPFIIKGCGCGCRGDYY